MARHAFCREVCLNRGEPLTGTGAVAGRILLLRWPRGKWRSPREDSVEMSATLRAALIDANEAAEDGFIALGDHVGETDNVPQLQCWPEGIVANYGSDAALAAAIRAWGRGRPLQGKPERRITILTCTDSRRDACCARFGFATFKALKEQADPTRFQLLQSNHIGGCRFAASLLVLPRRERYGRLPPEEVPAFLQILEQGDIYLPAYRGRADVPEAFQVAETAGMEWGDAQGIARHEVQIVSEETPPDPSPGARLAVALRAANTPLTVHLAATVHTVQIDCTAVAADESQTASRWQVVSVDIEKG